jgi:acyl transferase domain-containing protein
LLINNIDASSIAITGFAGVFPNAAQIIIFWENVVSEVNATGRAPSNRWIAPIDWIYDTSPRPDRAYSRFACLIDHSNDSPRSSKFSLPSYYLSDPAHQWTADVCRKAFKQTQTDTIQASRIGVILAAIALPTELSSTMNRRTLLESQLSANSHGKNRFGVTQGQGLSGRIVGIPAAVASWSLGLNGIAYTLDAACASSIYAIYLASRELQSHRADLMLAGGVSRPDPLYTQIGFTQLRALSRSGRCAPFDASADGLVVGEGAGVLALKRLGDAIQHEDTIYGVIRGIGLSNDMRGNLLSPESAGQLRAMRSAYDQSGWQPQDVDLIECHGAGTPVGDAAELASLRKLWGDDGWEEGQCAIGSVKSNIGHLLTAAGAAGMIKTLLALKHKTLPPSLKFEKPPKNSPLIGGPFRVQTKAEPWQRRDDRTTRKAAVSAFGFGGINAHVLIEEWRGDENKREKASPIAIESVSERVSLEQPDIAIVGMDLTLGALESVPMFEKVFYGNKTTIITADQRWKSLDAAKSILRSDKTKASFVGAIEIGIGEFHLPPGELPDILPQQLLMLKVAAGAMRDAGLPLREARERMGAIIGIAFDYESTNFHLRWALPKVADEWIVSQNKVVDSQALQQWLEDNREKCGPPLTAARTLGALGGIVASRIAREFKFGGPSFVVSAEEASGMQAVEIGMRMLQSGELDAVLVGAVDLNCDVRNLATQQPFLQFSPSGQVRAFDDDADGTLPGEGAVAMVLKRYDDVQRDGDRIYAVVKGSGSASGPNDPEIPFVAQAETYSASIENALHDAGIVPEAIGLVEAHGSGDPQQDKIEAKALASYFGRNVRDAYQSIAIGTSKPNVGHTGAASGMVSLAKAALCLHHRFIPPAVNFTFNRDLALPTERFHIPIAPAYWSRDRDDPPAYGPCVGHRLDGRVHAYGFGRSTGRSPNGSKPEAEQLVRPNNCITAGVADSSERTGFCRARHPTG